MGLPPTTLMHPPRSEASGDGSAVQISDQLLGKARADQETVLKELASRLDGLTQAQANERLKQIGPNEIAREKHQSALMRLLTFFMMLYLFDCWQNPALFHTGWFVESIFTQTLIIHVIRTDKIPYFQSWASWPLILSSVIIVTLGALLTVSPLANTLGLVALPARYWLLLAAIVVSYMVLTQLVKTWFYRRFAE